MPKHRGWGETDDARQPRLPLYGSLARRSTDQHHRAKFELWLCATRSVQYVGTTRLLISLPRI
jgi:hypothetical protein